MKRKTAVKVTIIIGFLVLVSPASALAYIDPGTGSMMLQALAVAAFSCLFFIKRIWNSIKSFFNRNSDDE